MSTTILRNREVAKDGGKNWAKHSGLDQAPSHFSYDTA